MLNKIEENQLNQALLQLGLEKKEAQVYSAALERRYSSVIDLAKDTGLSRGTVYDIVEKLKKGGFLAEVKQGLKRRIVVENPTNKFYNLLNQKHQELTKAKNLVEDILPIIKSVNAAENFKPQIRVYTGKDGFRKVWDEILSFGGENFLSISRIETFVKFIGEDFLDEIQKKKSTMGISSRAINENSKLAVKMYEADKKYNRETRLAPKGFEFPSSEIIFGDKIAMFSTREENIIMVIESKDFAQTHRVYFEMMWKLLEPKP
ncbi:MAG: helix-turn-helix domain-containing protein [Candidatus Buchananbacteria bacterium]